MDHVGFLCCSSYAYVLVSAVVMWAELSCRRRCCAAQRSRAGVRRARPHAAAGSAAPCQLAAAALDARASAACFWRRGAVPAQQRPASAPAQWALPPCRCPAACPSMCKPPNAVSAPWDGALRSEYPFCYRRRACRLDDAATRAGLWSARAAQPVCRLRMGFARPATRRPHAGSACSSSGAAAGQL